MLSLYCLTILTLHHLKALQNYLITWKNRFILLIFNSYCNLTVNFRIMTLKPLPNVTKRYVHLRFIKGNKNEIFLKNINMPCPRFYSPMSLLLYSAIRNISFVGWLNLFEGAFSRYFHLNRLLRRSRDILCLLQVWMFPGVLLIFLSVKHLFLRAFTALSSMLNWLINRLTKGLKFHEYFFFLFD